jgi:formylglycine-generating enzyme required for sulfatase activity
MGAVAGDPEAEPDEKPNHEVTVTSDFYLAATPVTQSQWLALMDSNPSQFVGPELPVEGVSFPLALEFIQRLNEREKTQKYRLPTESEWELAARGGASSVYFFGNDPQKLGQYAWNADNSARATHPVGLKKANSFGLFDVYGNVFEWASDYYDAYYYEFSPILDPQGPREGSLRSSRGCAWTEEARYCRSSDRGFLKEESHYPNQGLRLAYTAIRPSNSPVPTPPLP